MEFWFNRLGLGLENFEKMFIIGIRLVQQLADQQMQSCFPELQDIEVYVC